MSKTLSKALYLLTLFNESDSLLKIDDLSKKADIPKSTAYRLLKTLENYSFIRKANYYQGGTRVETEYYQLGLRCLELGSKVAEQFEVRQIALPSLRNLRDDLQESVQLVVRDGDEAIYIEKVEAEKPVRLYTKIGRRAPLYAGACPRVIFSFLNDAEIAKILGRQLHPIGSKTVTSKEEQWELIRWTRKKGYTFSDSELEDGSAAFATPIFDRFGNIAASLSVAGFSAPFIETDDMNYIVPMWKVSSKVSKSLGFKGNYPYLKQ